jgi:hypothetical protein
MGKWNDGKKKEKKERWKDGIMGLNEDRSRKRKM